MPYLAQRHTVRMKLHLIQQYVHDFIHQELNTKTDAWVYAHAMTDHFHTTWSWTEGPALRDIYDASLWSAHSTRWWKRDGYRPKEIMLRLIDTDPELALIAFRDLARSEASLEGRISRFQFYMDDLLAMWRDRDVRMTETYHHQDAAMMSLYLAGWYPDRYSLYPGLQQFISFCKKVGSSDIPKVDDLFRHTKVCAILHTYLQKNESYPDLISHRQQQKGKLHPFMLTFELMCFIADQSSSAA